jgi:uridine kinase
VKERPLVVGIAGGTASGKTTVARGVADRLGALLLTHDRYYRSADAHTNFDHPDALDTARMVADLDTLREGRPASLPDYDFATHRRRAAEDVVAPTPVIVVEGILVLADASLRARFDLAVFVDAPADVRLVRRVQRDVAERGRTVESVLAQYLATVRPMHEAFVAPSLAHAHLVLDGTAEVEGLVGAVCAAVARARAEAPAAGGGPSGGPSATSAPETARRVARAWLAAFDTRDVDALVGLYAPDATHTTPRLRATHPETGGVLRGADALHAWWSQSLADLPGLAYREIAITVAAERAVIEYDRVLPGHPTERVAVSLALAGGRIVASRVHQG